MPLLDDTNPIAATLTGIIDRVRMRRTVPPLVPDERADGRLALVTGASSGLGFATAVDLGRRGARVLMVDRDDPAAAAVRAAARVGTREAVGAPAVSGRAGAGRFEGLTVDLGDLRAVERLATEVAARTDHLDLLVLNAGIVPTAARNTPQGLDEMFVVNYLSSFALVEGLRGAGALGGGARRPRIVVVSSEAHRWADGRPFAELAGGRDPAVARVMSFYSEYKLLLTTFAWELHRRLNADGARGAGVYALCPGAMNTNIGREAPRLARPLLRAVMRLFFADPFAADEPVIYLACSRDLEAASQSPVYLHRMTRKEPDPRARDPERGRALWEASAALLARLRG